MFSSAGLESRPWKQSRPSFPAKSLLPPQSGPAPGRLRGARGVRRLPSSLLGDSPRQWGWSWSNFTLGALYWRGQALCHTWLKAGELTGHQGWTWIDRDRILGWSQVCRQKVFSLILLAPGAWSPGPHPPVFHVPLREVSTKENTQEEVRGM